MSDAQAVAADIRILVEGLNQRLEEAQRMGLAVEIQYAWRGDYDNEQDGRRFLRAAHRLRVHEISRQELL